MKLLEQNYWSQVSTSIVRDNLMKEEGYTGYCGDELCLPRTSWSPSNPYGAERWPRTKWNKDLDQFCCPKCGWVSQYPIGFIIEYKRKWGKLYFLK